MKRVFQWVEQKGGVLGALLLLAVATDLVCRSVLRAFWFDELFTVYLARLDLSVLWNALSAGTDANPPLSYLVTRLFQRWLGESEWATRLPSVIAFVVAVAFLYRYVARRTGPLLGLSAGLLFCLTGVYFYGAEARPYAMVLGCCSVALWSWSSRRVFIFGASLTLAMASHYYALLLLIPFGVGELVYAIQQRRIRWPIWGALAFSALSVVVYLPLLRGVAGQKEGFWSPMAWPAVRGFFSTGFGDAWQILLAVGIVCLLSWRRGRTDAAAANSVCPASEWTALLALLLLPVPAMILGAVYTNAFVPRYVLPSFLGFSALVALALQAVFGRASGWKPAMLLVLIFGFGVIRLVPTVGELVRYGPRRTAIVDSLWLAGRHGRIGTNQAPIVVASPMWYPVQVHYSKPELRKRLVYLADPATAFRFRRINTPDLALLKLACWTELRVEAYRAFLSHNGEFFVLHAPGDRFAWLMDQLQQDGRSAVLVGVTNGCQLLLLHP